MEKLLDSDKQLLINLINEKQQKYFTRLNGWNYCTLYNFEYWFNLERVKDRLFYDNKLSILGIKEMAHITRKWNYETTLRFNYSAQAKVLELEKVNEPLTAPDNDNYYIFNLKG